MGFDAMFFARMDSGEAGIRIENKGMEWIQKPVQNNFGVDYEILFHLLDDGYSAPDGFNFELTSGRPPFETDVSLETLNAQAEGKKLDEFLEKLSNVYATDHLFVLFG
jgi:hypothetical protein